MSYVEAAAAERKRKQVCTCFSISLANLCPNVVSLCLQQRPRSANTALLHNLTDKARAAAKARGHVSSSSSLFAVARYQQAQNEKSEFELTRPGAQLAT